MFLIPKKLDQNRSSLKNLLTQNAFGQKPKSRGWKKSDKKKNSLDLKIKNFSSTIPANQHFYLF